MSGAVGSEARVRLGGRRWAAAVVGGLVFVLLMAAIVGWGWQRSKVASARAAMERRDAVAVLAALGERDGAQWEWFGGGDEVAYLRGQALWESGRRAEAVGEFERVSERSQWWARASFYVVEQQIAEGRLAEAEERLLRMQGRLSGVEVGEGEPSEAVVIEWLIRLYKMEARYGEAEALTRAYWPRARDRIAGLKDVWVLDRGSFPLEPMRESLEALGKKQPDDERIWLGLARVASGLGRGDEAERWWANCVGGRRVDDAVWRAGVEIAAQRGDAVGVRDRLQRLRVEELTPEERFRWAAWLRRASGDALGERAALELAEEVAPGDPVRLERLASLLAVAGERAGAAKLLEQKARVDEALDRYNERMRGGLRVEDALELAGLAETCGRTWDAWAWLTLAQDGEADDPRLAGRLDGLRGRVGRLANGDEGVEALKQAIAAQKDVVSPSIETESRRLAFVDEAKARGVDFTFVNGATPIRQVPETMSGGVGLLDYDGDGWLDIYVVQGGTFPPQAGQAFGDRLYRNRGDGTFEDATEKSGLASLKGGYGHGVAVGDVNNDGFPELFVTRWRAVSLYRNGGDGTFREVTREVGLEEGWSWPTSAALADLDGDGDLDLYVCQYLKWDETNPKICRDGETQAYFYCTPRDMAAIPDRLFRNDGDRFVDVSSEAGITAGDTDGRGLGVVAADLDEDGRVDLYVANDMTANFLWRNLGGMKFEEVSHAAGVAGNAEGGYQAGMGVACGDLDGDGQLDLAVTNFYGEGTTLYHNFGGGVFADWSQVAGLSNPTRNVLGFGLAAADVDNDGRLDLIQTNGHVNDSRPLFPYAMPSQVFLGAGEGRMVDASAGAGADLAKERVGRALAVGDLDHDGRLDLVVLPQNGSIAVLMNRTEGVGKGIELVLEGRKSPRDGTGVVVVAEAGGKTQRLVRAGGGSYQSSGNPSVHLGTGTASVTGRVEVRWPSGTVDVLEGLEAGRRYRVSEGAGLARP